MTLTTKNTFSEHFEGHKLNDRSRRIKVTIVILGIGLFALYNGLTEEPIDWTIAGIGTVFTLYSLFLRNIIFKNKLLKKWKALNVPSDVEVTYAFTSEGVSVSTEMDGEKLIPWTDFSSCVANSKVICLYFKLNPNNWLTIPITGALEPQSYHDFVNQHL